MIFDLDQAEGGRFQFFASTVDPVTGKIIYAEPAGDGYVTLRPMQQFYNDRIAKRKQAQPEWVHNPVTRAMEKYKPLFKDQTIEEIKAEREDAWDYAIIGFEGFKDKKGNIIECTRENKLKMIKNPMFERFCARCFEIMANSGIEQEEALIKNSQALPSGHRASGGKAVKSVD